VAAIGILIFVWLIQVFSGQLNPGADWQGHEIKVIRDIAVPEGFQRIACDTASFGYWMREFPLKPKGTRVMMHNGLPKPRQNVHYAVLDIEIGKKDLQQCADAAIRLFSEYHYEKKFYDRISYNFTSGDTASFRKWIEGWRPTVNGNKVTWKKSAEVDSSYGNFKEYQDIVFTYAGTYSLSKQFRKIGSTCEMEIGDLFIIGGFPGHAVFVVDIAENTATGRRLFMLAQGFTPAQDFHILRNPNNDKLSPWYECPFGEILNTPEWNFNQADLYRPEL